jgi:CspA family cold shock protein
MDTKGYGFITEEVEKKDYFFHFSGALDKVRQNDVVSFEVEIGKKGPKAVNIKMITKADVTLEVQNGKMGSSTSKM